MKKMLMMAVCLILGVMAAKADERPIVVTELPKEAQSFIKKYFPKEKDMLAFVDKGIFSTDYEVKFGNTKLEFTEEGEWKEVECKYGAVPADIVPKNVAASANEYFSNVAIVKIERDRRGYEIKLANGMEMKFDSKGNLVGIDD
ncbi:MAG: PepSY-like domain-containing protein [Bacteroidales bacterium]|nr:PepSY-like domain-containing protein [Bacteroidales bacterium]